MSGSGAQDKLEILHLIPRVGIQSALPKPSTQSVIDSAMKDFSTINKSECSYKRIIVNHTLPRTRKRARNVNNVV